MNKTKKYFTTSQEELYYNQLQEALSLLETISIVLKEAKYVNIPEKIDKFLNQFEQK